MPDWQKLIDDCLGGLALEAQEKSEVRAELAAHLDDSFNAFCSQGLPENEAAHRTVQQIGDWQELRRNIFAAKRKERPMHKRLRQLWIPGFLTFILSTTSLAIVQKLGLWPLVSSWNGTSNTVLFCVPWLLSLPCLGALGAYFSVRAGAARPTVLLASGFPVLALAAAFILMFPIDMIVEPIVGNHADFGIVATAILKDGTSWLLVPGAALLVGGLLVSILFGRRTPWQNRALDSETTHA